ncbi:phospholipase [Pseudorhodobacter sp. E13]|uniref:phospholipase D-like domain-containing protein n=1 Tax=Pseudorhodobacter sp. E13 TaxID=2487931 RepID=UPI000F8DB7BC|nr:phospholipase D-like domain-containing protein [Pseudorhodobacter sp. E13]RUS59350.1 phospholipase [Pseudorhodobacter sp. E13]
MTQPPKITDLRLLITAAEAYPALERAFLAAETEISASFLVFDLTTRLRSPEAREIGETWFDLILHCLRRGVALRFVLSDFDPAARPEMHKGTWHSLRRFIAAAELAGPEARLEVKAALHPAQTGILPRLLLWPMIYKRLWDLAQDLNALSAPQRSARLRDMPAIAARMRHAADGTVSPRFWALPKLYPGTHHQKLAVIDRKWLYIGGLDLDERRYDTTGHDRPSSQTWHDVQLLLRGPVAEDAATHLDQFLDLVSGKRRPARRGPGQGRDTAPLLTTLSRRRRGPIAHIGPKTISSALYQRHISAVSRSTRLIYLESQYFRHVSFARALARAARRNPDLGLVLMLPGAPEELVFEHRKGLDTRMGEWLQARCLRILQRSFGPRLFVGGAAQKRDPETAIPSGRAHLSGAPLIYIHAKVSIFDEREAIVSSANLNGRSFRWDTECGVHLTDPEEVAALRQRLMQHWLPDGAGAAFFADATAVSAWRGLALSNAALAPQDRRGFVVPYDLHAAEAFGTPVPFVPEALV